MLALSVLVAPAASAHRPEMGFDPAVPTRFSVAPVISGFAIHDGIGDNDMDRVELVYESRQNNQLAACALPAAMTYLVKTDPTRIDFSSEPTFVCNGRYRVVATATSKGTTAVHNVATNTAAADFEMALVPSNPQGLSTSVNVSAGRITVDWNDNTEVDLIGYAVFRREPGASQTNVIAVVTESRYVDTDASQAGSYRYEIQAIRMGPSQDTNGTDALFSGVAATSATQAAPATTAPPTEGTGTVATTDSTVGSTSTSRASSPPLNAGSNNDALERLRRQAAASRSVPDVEIDTGFDENLPFDVSGRPNSAGEVALSGARHEVFVEVHDRRAVLAPLAGGLVLFLGAVHMRMMSRRLRALDITG